MKDIMNTFFGPLDVTYCNYFYFISIIGFVLLSISLVTFVLSLTKRSGIDRNSLMFLVQAFLIYFVNRLLYSMCRR